ncbi:hypothetical protein [Streptomyces rimosus]|uniref:hypothetical protein n=1 Tax=Streptomyces rimosus TaxID=1927 RepID=UPI0004C87803|nr:hypothetical protein [Streptomyces rimosus]
MFSRLHKELDASQHTNGQIDPRQLPAGGVGWWGGGIGSGQDDHLTFLQGYIVSDTRGLPKKEKPYYFKFHYNPSTVSMSHGLDQATMQPAQWQRAEADTGTALLPINSSCSFSLFFDRTYDILARKSTPQSKYGVMYDVNALYNLVGINSTSRTGGSTGTSTDPNSEPSPDAAEIPETVTGPMQMRPCTVFFGGQDRALFYYGFISSVETQWVHWTQDMTTQRVSVSITMTGLPQPK